MSSPSPYAALSRRPSNPYPREKAHTTVSRSQRMPSLFSTIRASLYGTVLLFTIICLAMAGHFQSVLAASDLTRFVPFAIFVCTASLFIFLILLLFSWLLRERNPISTRIELASLAVAGLFWLILGVYLTTSESQDAEVECFPSADSQIVLDPEVASLHTDQFQAMYRVLMAFALMNAALIILAFLILLFLAVRRHRNGDVHMWHGPVTSGAWFNTYNAKAAGAGYSEKHRPSRRQGSQTSKSLLPTMLSAGAAPAPLTQKPERRTTTRSNRDRERGTATNAPTSFNDRSERTRDPQRQNSKNSSSSRREYRDLQAQHSQHPYGSRNPYGQQQHYNQPLPSVPRQARYASGGAADFDSGGMVNPARAAAARRS